MKKELTASEMGRIGGKNRMSSMTPEQRKELARKGAEARWKKRLTSETK